MRAVYEERAERHSELELNLLCDRIGQLGPDPRGLAFWGAPSYAALDEIARELDGVEQPDPARHGGALQRLRRRDAVSA